MLLGFFLPRRYNLYRKCFWVKTVLSNFPYFDVEIVYTSWLGRW